ncbi:DUF58 domain-containing protein [Arenibacterium sp. CAU 1754]
MTAALDVPGIALQASSLIKLRALALGQDESGPLSRLPGGFVTRKRGRGQEMADVREYVQGDDIRHLDRGSTARTGTLHVRSFQEERDRVTVLMADFRPSMLWGTRRAFCSVVAAEALCLIGWRVVEEGGRVGLVAVGAGDPVVIPIRGRTRGMLGVIGGLVRAHDAALNLALAGERDDPPLDAGLARVSRIAPSGAEVVIASGFEALGETFADRLGQLAQVSTPRLLAVTDGVSDRLSPGVYPIRLPNGVRRRVRITEAPSDPRAPQVSGFETVRIDAGDTSEAIAGVLNAAFPADRGP